MCQKQLRSLALPALIFLAHNRFMSSSRLGFFAPLFLRFGASGGSGHSGFASVPLRPPCPSRFGRRLGTAFGRCAPLAVALFFNARLRLRLRLAVARYVGFFYMPPSLRLRLRSGGVKIPSYARKQLRGNADVWRCQLYLVSLSSI